LKDGKHTKEDYQTEKGKRLSPKKNLAGRKLDRGESVGFSHRKQKEKFLARGELECRCFGL
jgi:hypothetical protein